MDRNPYHDEINMLIKLKIRCPKHISYHYDTDTDTISEYYKGKPRYPKILHAVTHLSRDMDKMTCMPADYWESLGGAGRQKIIHFLSLGVRDNLETINEKIKKMSIFTFGFHHPDYISRQTGVNALKAKLQYFGIDGTIIGWPSNKINCWLLRLSSDEDLSMFQYYFKV